MSCTFTMERNGRAIRLNTPSLLLDFFTSLIPGVCPRAWMTWKKSMQNWLKFLNLALDPLDFSFRLHGFNRRPELVLSLRRGKVHVMRENQAQPQARVF